MEETVIYRDKEADNSHLRIMLDAGINNLREIEHLAIDSDIWCEGTEMRSRIFLLDNASRLVTHPYGGATLDGIEIYNPMYCLTNQVCERLNIGNIKPYGDRGLYFKFDNEIYYLEVLDDMTSYVAIKKSLISEETRLI